MILSVWDAGREYLLRESAPGSDAGLCIAQAELITAQVMDFARRAKHEVLTMLEAEEVASQSQIRLAGLTGTGGGIIGALAGVGLHRAGEDGRFLWLPGVRELSGAYPVAQICWNAHVDRVCTVEGIDLPPETPVQVGEWARPVLRGGLSTLFVEEKNHEWCVLPKERIKSLSS